MPAQHHRRAAAAALAAAALAAGALSAPTTATAAEGDSPLVLTAPDRIKVRSHDGWVYSDFGLEMAAQGADFEVRANRPSYEEEISAVWKSAGGDVPITGDGLSMTSWRGLDDFATVVIRKEGRRRAVQKLELPGCFNSWSSRPTSPDHTAANDYPWACPYNPYTVGSVMGISQGWAVPALGEYGYYQTRLKPGSYTVTMRIARPWRDFFGISEADGSLTRPMKVKEGRSYEGGYRAPTRPTARVAEGDSGLEAAGRMPAQESVGALDESSAPDLKSLPAFDISLSGNGRSLRFGANVWNGGNGPMVVEGYEPVDGGHRPAARHDGERHLDAYQYFYDQDGEITGHEMVGEFTFHEGNHNHWHFEDFASYTLLNADKSEAVRSSKVSFCLANTDAVDYTIPNAEWRPGNTDLGSDCGGRSASYLRQVLDTGSGDTYHQFRTGQAFRVGNLPDGVYYISVKANPVGNLLELDTENNESLRKVVLKTNKRDQRRVVVRQVGVVEEESWGYFRTGR